MKAMPTAGFIEQLHQPGTGCAECRTEVYDDGFVWQQPTCRHEGWSQAVLDLAFYLYATRWPPAEHTIN